jgi:hypothetical protein
VTRTGKPLSKNQTSDQKNFSEKSKHLLKIQAQRENNIGTWHSIGSEAMRARRRCSPEDERRGKCVWWSRELWGRAEGDFILPTSLTGERNGNSPPYRSLVIF